MEIAEHLSALRAEGEQLAAAAERAGLDTATPSCPEWTVRELLRHTGGVHRWATFIVSTGHQDPRTLNNDDFFEQPPDDELLDWYRTAHGSLVDVVSSADPGLECFAFLRAPSPLAFWARRQAHETTMHRIDAELASGERGPIDAAFAADGLGELLEGFMVRRRVPLVADPPRTLAVHARDDAPEGGQDTAGGAVDMPADGPAAGAHWLFHIGPEGRSVERVDRPADCSITGSAADLYLLLWNRVEPDVVRCDGDREILDLWRRHATVRWS